jgi:hypothetical protein
MCLLHSVEGNLGGSRRSGGPPSYATTCIGGGAPASHPRDPAGWFDSSPITLGRLAARVPLVKAPRMHGECRRCPPMPSRSIASTVRRVYCRFLNGSPEAERDRGRRVSPTLSRRHHPPIWTTGGQIIPECTYPDVRPSPSLTAFPKSGPTSPDLSTIPRSFRLPGAEG